MAQRYTHPLALARMEQGNCPECGLGASFHDSNPLFWQRSGADCSLLPAGVTERIEQYRDDLKEKKS